MPDEPVVAPVADPVVAPVADPVYFGNDGVLNEGWQSTLPEGYRDEKSLSTVSDAKVLAKMFVDTKRMVGKDVVAIPGDSSTEGEWQEFHKAGGRPETVEDYGLKAPEGMPPELASQVFPEERVKAWQDRFFKGGVSKKAADSFIQEYAQDIMADYKAMESDKALKKEGIVAELETEYGAAFDQKMHLGDIAFEEGSNGDQAMKESLAYFRDDPNAVKFLVNLGAKFAESKPPNFSAIPTPGDYKDQIAELQADPLYLKGTRADNRRITDKIMVLRNKMHPEDK